MNPKCSPVISNASVQFPESGRGCRRTQISSVESLALLPELGCQIVIVSSLMLSCGLSVILLL